MQGLSITDSANISGMSLLINSSGSTHGFNLNDLENQITAGERPVNRNNVSQNLTSELDKIMGGYKPINTDANVPFERPVFSTSDDLDALLNENTLNDTSNFEPTQSYGNEYPDGDPNDSLLSDLTNEQRKQNIIQNAFSSIDDEQGQRPTFSVEKEKEEDEKSRKLEGIESLREILEDEGENLSRIPNVTTANSINEIDNVYKMLNLKNDRKRCCSFAEEGILLGAAGVEWAFDGEKSYFGHKPVMTGWNKSVQSKLRRMRHDTSNVVSQVMQHYNLGSGTRILLELIPSMFLYSRLQKIQHKDNIVNDAVYGDALNKLRDHDTPSD